MNQASLFHLAWKVVPRLPAGLVEGLAGMVGRAAALGNGRSVRQMRSNHRKLTGTEPTRREVGAAVASYFRCFGEQFSLSGWGSRRISISMVYPGVSRTRELMDSGPVVLALTHSGNWDLAGAWFCKMIGPIVTVAERLEPPQLFQSFVDFRESLGMEIIGVSKGEKVFERLVKKVEGRGVLVPLLADRDISGSGVQTRLGTEDALVAAGPAALALRLNRPLIAGHIVYRKVGRWPRRRWIIRAIFSDPITPPEPEPGETAVEALTRAWVREVEPSMVTGVRDWHMMQKLYVSDLDPERLERARLRHQEGA